MRVRRSTVPLLKNTLEWLRNNLRSSTISLIQLREPPYCTFYVSKLTIFSKSGDRRSTITSQKSNLLIFPSEVSAVYTDDKMKERGMVNFFLIQR